MGTEGAKAIAEALVSNHTMATLWLDYCGISELGAFVLAAMLKVNATITKLSIRIEKDVTRCRGEWHRHEGRLGDRLSAEGEFGTSVFAHV